MRLKKERRRAGYYLLFRREDREKVWLYEYLQKHEMRARERQGWRIVA